jgi:hypothetical protein
MKRKNERMKKKGTDQIEKRIKKKNPDQLRSRRLQQPSNSPTPIDLPDAQSMLHHCTNPGRRFLTAPASKEPKEEAGYEGELDRKEKKQNKEGERKRFELLKRGE